MLEERVNDPEAAEAIDPPGNAGGGGAVSLESPENVEQASAIDPPQGGGGG